MTPLAWEPPYVVGTALKRKRKICSLSFHSKQFIHLRLTELKEIRYESWTCGARGEPAIKDIIGGNWQNLNMDFDAIIYSNVTFLASGICTWVLYRDGLSLFLGKTH